jgi:hypothetical protein
MTEKGHASCKYCTVCLSEELTRLSIRDIMLNSALKTLPLTRLVNIVGAVSIIFYTMDVLQAT